MRRRLLLTVTAAISLIPVWPVGQAGGIGPDASTCAGYLEPRVFLESQGWWITQPGQTGTNFGHLHVGTCFPLNQQVWGIVPFDVRIVMHMNPGTVFHIQPLLCTGTGATGCVKYDEVPLNLTCDPMIQMTCTYWVHYDWNTLLYPYDGRTSFRFRTEAREPDGNVLRASDEWQAVISNPGKPISNFSPAGLVGGKGWYSIAEYSSAWIDKGYPQPTSSGLWKLTFHCASTVSTLAPALKECLVTVDPNFHEGIDGTVLYRGTSKQPVTLSIDLSKFAPGAHSLVIRAETVVNAPAGTSTKAGLLKVPFTVG